MTSLAQVMPTTMLRPGHTVFQNGLHSDGWLEKGEVVRDPVQLDALAAWQAAQIRDTFVTANLIAGASQCGAVLAAFLARHLRLPVVFLKIENGSTVIHRMHLPVPGKRIVLVDDLISTGTDARTLVKDLNAFGHEVVGLSLWMARQSATLPNTPVVTLWDAPFQSYSPQNCPCCQAGDPVRWRDVRE